MTLVVGRRRTLVGVVFDGCSGGYTRRVDVVAFRLGHTRPGGPLRRDAP